MPSFKPLPCTYAASAGIPAGNLVEFQRRVPLESRPFIQQSSRLTYSYPAAAIPLETIESAVALISASSRLHWNVFQEFQPMGGVAPREPLVIPPDPLAPPDPLVIPPDPLAPPDPLVIPPDPLVIPPDPLVIPPDPLIDAAPPAAVPTPPAPLAAVLDPLAPAAPLEPSGVDPPAPAGDERP